MDRTGVSSRRWKVLLLRCDEAGSHDGCEMLAMEIVPEGGPFLVDIAHPSPSVPSQRSAFATTPRTRKYAVNTPLTGCRVNRLHWRAILRAERVEIRWFWSLLDGLKSSSLGVFLELRSLRPVDFDKANLAQVAGPHSEQRNRALRAAPRPGREESLTRRAAGPAHIQSKHLSTLQLSPAHGGCVKNKCSRCLAASPRLPASAPHVMSSTRWA